MMPGVLKVSHIIAVVAGEFGTTAMALCSDKVQRQLIQARRAVALLACELTGASYPVIGRALGGRDHTTILTAHRAAQAALAVDPDFALQIEALRQALLIIQRANLLNILDQVDPVAAARRIDANPERLAAQATALEIAAMARLIVGLCGRDDDPIPFEAHQETADHAA
jgi:hypothetical protein